MYAGGTDTQIARDFSEVTTWIKEGGNEPTTIREANFQKTFYLNSEPVIVPCIRESMH